MFYKILRGNTGDRSQETGARRQEPGDRSQEPGDRRQETEDRMTAKALEVGGLRLEAENKNDGGMRLEVGGEDVLASNLKARTGRSSNLTPRSDDSKSL
jgi:hypothetical protein